MLLLTNKKVYDILNVMKGGNFMSNDIKANTFKEHLAQLMHEKHITKAQFCRDIEVSKPTLDKWLNTENGILPTLANTLLIAEKYNVSIDWLTGNEVIQVDNKEDEDIDIIQKTFDSIVFLDEHFNINLTQKIILFQSSFTGFETSETKMNIDDYGIAYFVQEYKKIKSVINDPNMFDFKEVIWQRFLKKFEPYIYSDEYKSFFLTDTMGFDYDPNKEELLIVKKQNDSADFEILTDCDDLPPD